MKNEHNIESLKPAPYNPRKPWSESKQKSFAESLAYFGDLSGIILSVKTGNLIGGHKRVDEFRKAGKVTIEKTPCKKDAQGTVAFGHVIADGNRFAYREVEWALKKEKQANLAANQWGAEWETDGLAEMLKQMDDQEREIAGFTDKEISDLDIELEDVPVADAEPQIDRAAELNKKWKVRRGDLWQIGEHRLLCGDSTKREDVERLMGDEKCDCVFTSPPYAVGVDYGKTYKDMIENLRMMLPLLSSLWKEIICDGGFAIVNFMDVVSASEIVSKKTPCEYPMALEYWPVFFNDGWTLWSRRIWCKPNSRVYSPWSMQTNRAASDWEHVWTWKTSGKPNVARVNGENQSANGWFDTSNETGVAVGKDEHGAGMATALPMRMIPIHSKKKSIVHEPFCGTGTTMVASQNLDRRCFGIEISPDYCAVIIERMEEAFGLTGKIVKK